MSLESATKISELVPSNPQGSDPKSHGDDHLRMIKQVLQNNAIKTEIGLGPAAENHFWDGSVANQLSLKRGTPDAPGTELMKFLEGVVSFPNQGQSLTTNGYVKLPGGLIVQWGTDETGATGRKPIVFPIPFPTKVVSIQATVVNETEADDFVLGAVIGGYATSLSQFVFGSRTAANVWIVARYFGWIAIGY
jgi:hypothetical protein